MSPAKKELSVEEKEQKKREEEQERKVRPFVQLST